MSNDHCPPIEVLFHAFRSKDRQTALELRPHIEQCLRCQYVVHQLRAQMPPSDHPGITAFKRIALGLGVAALAGTVYGIAKMGSITTTDEDEV